MKYLIQYKCTIPGCFHQESMESTAHNPPPIVQCNKHRNLPVMEVIANIPIERKVSDENKNRASKRD
jgi:hypothetical protein